MLLTSLGLACSQQTLLASIDLFYALPLLVVYSLVRAASRYDEGSQILAGAGRSAALISVLLLVIFLALSALDAWV